MISVEYPHARLEIVKSLSLGNVNLVIVMVSVRLDFTDFDLLPPSLTFVDPLTGSDGMPLFPMEQVDSNGDVRSLIVQGPRPFLCHPGIREYHEHDEHRGDDWRWYREAGKYSGLVWLADFLWTLCVDRVQGIAIQLVPQFALMTKGNGEVSS